LTGVDRAATNWPPVVRVSAIVARPWRPWRAAPGRPWRRVDKRQDRRRETPNAPQDRPPTRSKTT